MQKLGLKLEVVNAFFDPIANASLGRGIAYDLYDAPQPQSVHDSENVVMNVVVDQNMSTITPFSVEEGASTTGASQSVQGGLSTPTRLQE